MSVGASPACPSCHFGPAVPSRQFRSREWPVQDCPSCGCSFVWPRPNASELHELYDDYGAIFEQRHPVLRHRRDERYRSVLRLAEYALGRTGSLLDVGCSTGDFLAVAKEAGWKPVGIEWDATAARIAAQRTGLPVHVGNGIESLPGNDTFDLISMNHYIEHVREPGNEIAGAAQRLRSGGLVLLRTPNSACRMARMFGSLWTGFAPPVHLTYFRERTFQVVAEQMGLSCQKAQIWRGYGYSTPTELALVLMRGLSGSTGYRRLSRVRREAKGIRAITALRVLDSSPIIQRMFSRVDDHELLALLRRSGPAGPGSEA